MNKGLNTVKAFKILLYRQWKQKQLNETSQQQILRKFGIIINKYI